jgi:hypothetical protein
MERMQLQGPIGSLVSFPGRGRGRPLHCCY